MSISIKSKLLLIIVFTSASLFALSIFSINRINSLANSMQLTLASRFPLTMCGQQATKAVTHGINYLSQAMAVVDPEEIESVRVIEGRFRESMIIFDMFVSAVIFGSDSEDFTRLSGGITSAVWERNGWGDRLVVPRASDAVCAIARIVDDNYSEFARCVKAAFRSHKRALRLRLYGRSDEAAKEKAIVAANTRKAARCQVLVTGALGDLVLAIDEYVSGMEEGIAESRRNAISTLLLFSGTVFVLSVVVGLLFSTRVVANPVKRLSEAAIAIGEGRPIKPLHTADDDELGRLYTAFGTMNEKLARSKDEVESSKRYLDNVIKSMSSALIVVNPGGIIVVVNSMAVNLLEYDEKELVGSNINLVIAENELFGDAGIEGLAEGDGVSGLDAIFVSKHGKKIPVLLSASVIRGDGGKAYGTVCVATDITRLKDTEQRLKDAVESEHKKGAYIDRFNKLMVNREVDMIRLKDEVNGLLNELGRQEKYSSPDQARKAAE